MRSQKKDAKKQNYRGRETLLQTFAFMHILLLLLQCIERLIMATISHCWKKNDENRVSVFSHRGNKQYQLSREVERWMCEMNSNDTANPRIAKQDANARVGVCVF